MTPEFGQRVKITHKYNRRKGGRRKEYVPVEHNAEGIFLGLRTITNGESEYDSYGYYWMATEHFRVALVATGPHVNPIYVPIDAIEA